MVLSVVQCVEQLNLPDNYYRNWPNYPQIMHLS